MAALASPGGMLADAKRALEELPLAMFRRLGTAGSLALAIAGSVSATYGLKVFLERNLMGTKYRRLLFWRKKKVRVWIDGCYDLTHFGHYNAFRQAKAIGDVLVVGLNPDSEVIKHKGSPPLMTDEERYTTVSSCKWVDEVVREVPYVLDNDYLNRVVFGEYGCDYVVHGDDACLDCDGNDVFATSKAAGKYKEIKRTEGVSTTDLVRLPPSEARKGLHAARALLLLLVGRMLLMTRDHHARQLPDQHQHAPWAVSAAAGFQGFLATSRRIAEFSPNNRPEPHHKVVYVDGAFDLLLPGHCAFLRRARALGDFLVVGVHHDGVVNAVKGGNFPIMNLQERALAVLASRYVDEVVIGAPWEVSEDLLTTFNVGVVAHGTRYDRTTGGDADFQRAYRVAKEKGIFVEVEEEEEGAAVSGVSVETLIGRVVAQRQLFEAKYERKRQQEDAYYNSKTFKVEG